MWVRLPLPVPARRKRHITCDELFHFIVKLIARLFCRFSLPNRTRCAGLRLGVRPVGGCFALVKISVLTVLSTWWQSSLCDHVFFMPEAKRRHPPAPCSSFSNRIRSAGLLFGFDTDRQSLHLFSELLLKTKDTLKSVSFVFIPPSLGGSSFWDQMLRPAEPYLRQGARPGTQLTAPAVRL